MYDSLPARIRSTVGWRFQFPNIFCLSLSLAYVRAHTTAKRAFETRDWNRAERAKSDALGWRYVTLWRKVQCMMESITIKTLSLVYRDCPAHRTPFWDRKPSVKWENPSGNLRRQSVESTMETERENNFRGSGSKPIVSRVIHPW